MASSRPPRFPARILVVEDDPTLREAMVESLELDGYVVEGASNGAVGLEMALRNKPHVVVFDFWMPVTDGPTLVEELRTLVRPMPVLIGISAAAHALSWGREHGVPIFLLKPFEAATLSRAVEAAVSQVAEGRGAKRPSVSGTRPVARAACVVAVGSSDADVGLRETLPESLRDARIVIVQSAEEAEHILDLIVPDLLVLDDIDEHDALRARATVRAIPVLARPWHSAESEARLAATEPPPPSSIAELVSKKA
ncbi:MAG: hypothetical protein NVS3B10_10330 [Polyangiales bacterium]